MNGSAFSAKARTVLARSFQNSSFTAVPNTTNKVPVQISLSRRDPQCGLAAVSRPGQSTARQVPVETGTKLILPCDDICPKWKRCVNLSGALFRWERFAVKPRINWFDAAGAAAALAAGLTLAILLVAS
jgi:hypothetical protein